MTRNAAQTRFERLIKTDSARYVRERNARRYELTLAVIVGMAIATCVVLVGTMFVRYVVERDASELYAAERSAYYYMVIDSGGQWNVADYNLTLDDCVQRMADSDNVWFGEKCEQYK